MFSKRERILVLLNIGQVVRYYCPDISIRNSRCPCPIHGGRGNNLQIYPRTNSYYCFTCHSAGDPIKFIAELFNLQYKEAMEKANIDFGLHIGTDISFNEYRKLRNMARSRERRQVMRRQIYNKLRPLIKEREFLFGEWRRLQGYKADYAPQSPEEPLNDLYAYACGELPRLEFEIDRLDDEIAGLKENVG